MQKVWVTAYVSQPHPGLRDALKKVLVGGRHLSTYTSKRGALTVTLRPDHVASVALAPDLWLPVEVGSTRARHVSGANPSTVYPIPEPLFNLRPLYRLEAHEDGIRGESCQVVASPTGEKIAPFAISRKVADSRDWHSSARFSAKTLTAVQRDAASNMLRITCLTMETRDDVIVVHREAVAQEIRAGHDREPMLPNGLRQWQPAVFGLYERQRCESCVVPHYGLGQLRTAPKSA